MLLVLVYDIVAVVGSIKVPILVAIVFLNTSVRAIYPVRVKVAYGIPPLN